MSEWAVLWDLFVSLYLSCLALPFVSRSSFRKQARRIVSSTAAVRRTSRSSTTSCAASCMASFQKPLLAAHANRRLGLSPYEQINRCEGPSPHFKQHLEQPSKPAASEQSNPTLTSPSPSQLEQHVDSITSSSDSYSYSSPSSHPSPHPYTPPPLSPPLAPSLAPSASPAPAPPTPP